MPEQNEVVKIIGNIVYKSGTRERYNAQGAYDDKTLYWCEDTHELFKGINSYSEGLRHVDDHLALSAKAEGVIYMEPNGSGYVYEYDADKWTQVIYPITTVINASSTDEQIPTAKAVYDALQSVVPEPVDLSNYAQKDDLLEVKNIVEQCCTWGEI